MVHTVNLPVGTLTDIINVDDPNVLVPIESVVDSFKKDSEKTMRSMFSIPDINEKTVRYTSDIAYLTSCKKETIINTNKVRYFKVQVKYFPSEKETELIIPSYVKLFSRTAKSYVPVEFIRKSDILTDYTGNNQYPVTFYFNGIFANVFYNNFNKPVESDDSDEE